MHYTWLLPLCTTGLVIGGLVGYGVWNNLWLLLGWLHFPLRMVGQLEGDLVVRGESPERVQPQWFSGQVIIGVIMEDNRRIYYRGSFLHTWIMSQALIISFRKRLAVEYYRGQRIVITELRVWSLSHRNARVVTIPTRDTLLRMQREDMGAGGQLLGSFIRVIGIIAMLIGALIDVIVWLV